MSTINDNNLGPYSDLEEQQYHTLYSTPDVPLDDIRRKKFPLFLNICFLLLALAFLLAYFVKIPNYVQLPIIIENEQRDEVMTFSHSVRVTKYLVVIGDSIKTGQELCQISSPEINQLIARIRNAENDLALLQGYDSGTMKIQIENLDREQVAKKKVIGALSKEREATVSFFNSRKEALQSSINYRHLLHEKNKTLYNKGVISELDYLASERNYQEEKYQLELLTKSHHQRMKEYNLRTQEIKGSIVPISNLLNEIPSTYSTNAGKLENRIQEAKNNLELFYGSYKIENNSLVVLAQVDGLLSYRPQSNKMLMAGEVLYRLETSKGDFTAEGFIGANKIGYIKPGMQAKVMLETFPHYEWGSLSGEISSSSLSPNEDGQYTMSFALQKTNPEVFSLLQNGQTGTAAIIVQEKSLLNYIFENFKKHTSLE